jgi:uncharacterized protein
MSVKIRELRAAKDEFFRHSLDSPLDHAQRHGFTGLRYYPEDPAFRFVLDLDPSDVGVAEEVEMSNGSSAVMVRAGHFNFDVEATPVRLTAFRSEGHGSEENGSLFVPFRDATGRTESYPAGRYVEAEPTDDGRWLLDLNRAYNPYCAYNDAWRCPLPPRENWLAVEIRAGEKRFHDEP